jgi:hypothetical protein
MPDMLLEGSFEIVVWKLIAERVPECHEQLPDTSEWRIGATR